MCAHGIGSGCKDAVPERRDPGDQQKARRREKILKMRSAQTPFGAWAIMKKFILYALLSGSLISSLTVIKVYQSIMNKL